MIRALLAGTLLLASAATSAHNRSTSYSVWDFDDAGAQARARVTQLQLSRVQLHPDYTADYAATAAARLAQDLQLWSGGQPCRASQASAQADADGWIEARWRLDCTVRGDREIRMRLFESVAPSHLHFVRVNRAGIAPQQRVLSYAEPRLRLDEDAAAPDSLAHFVGIGFGHILDGWDHLAFLLMLILLAQSLREVLLIATGFTLAHSLSLAAASLGWVAVEQGRVEALIGFSIALVAAENIWLRSDRDVWVPRLFLAALAGFALLLRQHLVLLAALLLFSACYFGLAARAQNPRRLRLLLTLVFGLVHGFGFAGLMGELELPPQSLVQGLLGFNLGVELGQFAVVALVWPLLLLLHRRPVAGRVSQYGASCAVAGLGTFWFITRIAGS